MKKSICLFVFALCAIPALGSQEDRAIGSLMGLAVGDAMGVSQELIPRLVTDPEEMHRKVLKQRKTRKLRGVQKKMEGMGPFMPNLKLKPGEFTDDTSMALCLADSLICKEGLDPQDLMERFERWHCDGYNSSLPFAFGAGSNVTAALQAFKKDRTNPICGGRNESSNAGNGSIMRLAPVAMFGCADLDKCIEMARLQSSVTHNVSEALDAAAFLAEIIVRAIRGEPKERALISGYKFTNPLIAVLAEQDAAYKKKGIDEIRTLPGRASLSLEAALWSVHHSKSFEEAILLAVSLGGDADTVAAITGQIAGALYGEKQIPEDWIKTLAYYDKIRLKADALFHHKPYTPDLELKALK